VEWRKGISQLFRISKVKDFIIQTAFLALKSRSGLIIILLFRHTSGPSVTLNWLTKLNKNHLYFITKKILPIYLFLLLKRRRRRAKKRVLSDSKLLPQKSKLDIKKRNRIFI
jgi:hypothetical protein